MLADRPAAGQRRIGAEDVLDHGADQGAADRRIEHAAVLVAEPQAVDAQGRGQESVGQLDGDASDAERLSGDGLDLDASLGRRPRPSPLASTAGQPRRTGRSALHGVAWGFSYFNAIPSIQMCSGGAPQESKLIVR